MAESSTIMAPAKEHESKSPTQVREMAWFSFLSNDIGIDLAFRAVVGGENRADGFTRRLGALLAKYGHEATLQIRELAIPISLDSNPLHCPASLCFLLPNDRDVVFDIACRNASLTTRAAVKVDDHAPADALGVGSSLSGWIHALLLPGFQDALLGGSGGWVQW